MYSNNYIERLNKDILFLKGFKTWVKKEEPEYSEKGFKALEERLTELKRQLRKEYRTQHDEFEEKRVYEGFGYGESTKTYFDDYFDSKEEAEDYSPTGKWFISDIRVAHIEGNRWRVMIRESLDC